MRAEWRGGVVGELPMSVAVGMARGLGVGIETVAVGAAVVTVACRSGLSGVPQAPRRQQHAATQRSFVDPHDCDINRTLVSWIRE